MLFSLQLKQPLISIHPKFRIPPLSEQIHQSKLPVLSLSEQIHPISSVKQHSNWDPNNLLEHRHKAKPEEGNCKGRVKCRISPGSKDHPTRMTFISPKIEKLVLSYLF